MYLHLNWKSMRLKSGRDVFRTLSIIYSEFLFANIDFWQFLKKVCSANQWTGFYMITASVMKELIKDVWQGPELTGPVCFRYWGLLKKSLKKISDMYGFEKCKYVKSPILAIPCFIPCYIPCFKIAFILSRFLRNIIHELFSAWSISLEF